MRIKNITKIALISLLILNLGGCKEREKSTNNVSIQTPNIEKTEKGQATEENKNAKKLFFHVIKTNSKG